MVAKKTKNQPTEVFYPVKILIRASVLLSLLLPLVFFIPLYDIYDLSKVTVLRVLTIAMILMIVNLMFTSRQIELPKTKLAIPVAVLLLALVLSTVFSINPMLSIIGGIKRHEGLPTFISYLLLFWAGATFFSRKDWSKFEMLIAVTTLILSVHGIFQRFGYDFIDFGGSRYDVTRAFATTGNPVFLGQYLAFTAPFLVTRSLLFTGNNNRRILLAVASIFSLVCAVFTYSRASWAGIAFALLVLAVIGARRIIKSWKPLAIMLSLVLVIGGIIESNRQETGEASQSIVVRAKSMMDFANSTRSSMWMSTLPIIAREPLIGYGLETFKGVFPKYRELKLIKLEGEFSMPDRPHNEPLYLIYAFGLFGFTAFLWILIAFAWKSILYVRNADVEIGQFVVATGIAIIGYNITNFFSFSTVNTTAGYWALMGFASSVLSTTPKYIINLPKMSSLFKGSVYGLLIVVSLFSLIFSAKVFLSDYYYNKARFDHAFNNIEAAQYSAENAVNLNPYQSLYKIELATIYQSLAQKTGDVRWQLRNRELFSKGVSVDPRDQDSWANLAGITLSDAEISKDSKAVARAKEYYLKALELDPWFSIANEKLSYIYLLEGNIQEAKKHLINLISVSEKNIFALVNMAKISESEGDKQLAYEYYTKASAIEPDNQDVKDGLKRVKP